MKKITGKIIKHSAKITLEIIGFCVAAVLLIWMGLFWRLSLGPINVDFITKHLETGINTYAKGLKIDFGTTDLVWGGYKTPFELQVKNVQVFNVNNEPVLIIPRLGVIVSKRNLLMGSVVPKTVTLYNPAIRIIRTISGEMHLNIVPDHGTNDGIDDLSDDGGAEQARMLQNIISALKEGAHKDNPLSAFEGLKIKNAKLIFEDQKKGAIWHIKETDLSILRGKGGVVGAVVGDVSLGTTTTNVAANVFFQEKTGEIQVVSFVKHFNPAAFSKQADFLRPLSVVDSSLNGAMHFVLNRDLEILRGLVQVKGKAGQFNLPDLYKKPVIFNHLSLKFPFDIEKKSAKLDELLLTLTEKDTGPKVSITSDVTLGDDSEVSVSVQGEFKGGDFEIAHDYWPEKLTPIPRKWVLGHLSDGYVSRATLNLNLSFPKDNLEKIKVKHVSGEIDFENMTVDYFPPLEPVKKVVGHAHYNQKDFTLKIKSGRLKDMELSNADIIIDGFLAKKIKIDVNADLSGSIQTGLYVLNSEPLRYSERFNLNPENIEGQGDINVQLKFPLKKTLNINDIKIKTTAKLSDVVIKNAIEDMYLVAKTASLDVDNEGMTVKGSGHLAGAKVKFNWDEKFKEGADFKTRIEANLALDEKLLHRLGLPKALAFKKSIPTDLTYTALFNDKQTLFLHGDMTPISFDLDGLDYSKVSGAKGKLDMYVDFKSNIPQRIKSLNIDMEGLKLQGSVDLRQVEKKLDWNKVTLSKLEMGHSSVAVEIDNEGLKGYKASIKGASFDAQPFMSSGDKSKKNTLRQRVTPLRLGISVDKLIMGPQETLKKIEIFIKRNSWGLIDQFEMDGIAGQGQIYMRYLPTDNNKGHSFRFEADDAGSALRALDITKSVKGGSLVIDGHPNPKGGARDLIGKIQLSNFRLVKVPVLAKLLNAMSLVGIPELLSGKGIKFARLKTNFAWEEKFDKTTGQQAVKKMLLRKGRTSGASLGLNFSGIVDVLNEKLDLKGTIVPVSGLNKVIGQIPIFGPILTGGSNAVFAATYTIKGPTDRPTTTVNPLAALAPGILRRIFFEGN